MGIFHDLFDPVPRDAWKQFVTEVGGRCPEVTYGGISYGSRFEIPHAIWAVRLAMAPQKFNGRNPTYHTRMHAYYVHADTFRFQICRESLLYSIGKWFGMQDVQVGDPRFDNNFVVQANDESKAQTLCSNARIRDLVETLPIISFQVVNDEGFIPPGTYELSASVPGLITDVELLKHLYELMTETLDELSRMGSASPQPPPEWPAL